MMQECYAWKPKESYHQANNIVSAQGKEIRRSSKDRKPNGREYKWERYNHYCLYNNKANWKRSQFLLCFTRCSTSPGLFMCCRNFYFTQRAFLHQQSN